MLTRPRRVTSQLTVVVVGAQSEVWTPEPGGSGLPVLVWIDGGMFRKDSGSQASCRGTFFARDGVTRRSDPAMVAKALTRRKPGPLAAGGAMPVSASGPSRPPPPAQRPASTSGFQPARLPRRTRRRTAGPILGPASWSCSFPDGCLAQPPAAPDAGDSDQRDLIERAWYQLHYRPAARASPATGQAGHSRTSGRSTPAHTLTTGLS
jgi:hypothetical protein